MIPKPKSPMLPPWRRPCPPCSNESLRRLMFSPAAWLKLVWFLHAGRTEVGGFGISAKHDPLYVEDFVTVRQRTTAVTVAFDDTAVADFYDACVDTGFPPARFARVWIHTHPADSPHPSGIDEETFARAFGACHWAVMFIISRTGRTYARLSFSAGPGGQLLLPVEVDWAAWPQASADASPGAWAQQWKEEFDRNIRPWPVTLPRSRERGTEPDRAFDIDLLLGQSWPWATIESEDLGQLHEHHVEEADLVNLFETQGSLNEGDRTEVLHHDT